jgi:hypothetical protein
MIGVKKLNGEHIIAGSGGPGKVATNATVADSVVTTRQRPSRKARGCP